MGGEAPPQHLRCTFDGAAAIYHEARPAYPAKLFDDLIELADLKPGARLLEVGCGTGKATLPLASRGYAVVCVELGANLADQARANLADYPVEIDVAPFETWAGHDGSFDLVYAATAWRWIDPTVRYAKARALLRPAGHLAFWNAAHAFPADVDPFFADIQAVYDEIGESRTGEWPPLPPDLTPADTAEITATGLFEHVQVRRYVWEVRYTADEYIGLLDTFSGHIAMESHKREHLYAEVRRRIEARADQHVRRHWLAVLHVAKRRDD
jgi:SAM-dependent methyltransferase